jgi:galactokinase
MPGFLARFGVLPDSFGSARGRVNLIGEHTDTSEGYVLPISIARETRIELALRSDGIVRVASSAFIGEETFELGREQKRGSWIDYIQGTVHAFQLAAASRGASPLRGFDAVLTSDLPIGAGLASSAALEIALIRALCMALAIELEPVAIARIGRAAETDFVGIPSGIMDQMVATVGTTRAALFLDTRRRLRRINRCPCTAWQGSGGGRADPRELRGVGQRGSHGRRAVASIGREAAGGGTACADLRATAA